MTTAELVTPLHHASKHSIPTLEEYGLDADTGFLGSIPLHRLSGDYFEPWERTLDDLSHLLVSWKLREHIQQQLPELDANLLKNEAEYERAFLVLSLLSHAYVWGAKGEPVLPRNLGVPWQAVSVRLGLRPISCHSALVYYNWRKLKAEGPVDLTNLATLHTVSGGIDESWFYLVTIAIEGRGAKALPSIVSALNAIEHRHLDQLAKDLKQVADAIHDISRILLRMPENCDPYIFYHRVRIYFSGWSNMQGLPLGLLYEGDRGEIEKMFYEEGWTTDLEKAERKRYPGGSAAQSSLIHTLDTFLGVQHWPTGERPGSTDAHAAAEKRVNFIKEMRRHRRWLRALEQAPSLHDFVHSLSASTDAASLAVIDAYNLCVDRMKNFRDKHIQIVTRYILIQARRAAQTGQDQITGEGYGGMGPRAEQIIRVTQVDKVEDRLCSDMMIKSDGLDRRSTSTESDEDDNASSRSRGTGGTDIMPFLKQSRDETMSARVGKPLN